MMRRNGSVAQDVRKRPAIRSCARSSTTAAVSLLALARTASAFLGQGPTLLAISPGAYSHHPYTKRVDEMVLSLMADDALPRADPWVIMEEIKLWVVRNRGNCDLTDVQNAISDLRDECQFNIHTLETEITIIQQRLPNAEYYQSQCASTFSSDSAQQDDGEGAGAPIPTLKAVFAGYKVTTHDRMRLMSAHPEDHSL